MVGPRHGRRADEWRDDDGLLIAGLGRWTCMEDNKSLINQSVNAVRETHAEQKAERG